MRLILLIGTNPIPNYVAAMYALTQKCAGFYLVHTLLDGPQQGTEEIAKELAKALGEKGVQGDKIELVPLDNASDKEKINNNLNKEPLGQFGQFCNNEEVILNYTGGTKAMAVHVYTWLRENQAVKKDQTFFQYLDARTNKIITDEKTKEDSEDLRTIVCMESINTMLALHGYEPRPKNDIDPFPNITNQFENIINQGEVDHFFEMIKLLRKIYYDDNSKIYIKSAPSLREHFKRDDVIKAKNLLECILSKPKNVYLVNLLNSFGENKILVDSKTIWGPSDSDSNNTTESRTKKCIHDYLDGKWLEFHVLRAVEKMANGTTLIFGHSVEAYKASGSKKFELDLFVLRGYQLTGISVTTAGGSEAKLKAFEVMHRVRQIGGEEARGVLVANLSKKNRNGEDEVLEMENDIKFLFTGSTSKYFTVISREDWEMSNLTKKLEDVIWD